MRPLSPVVQSQTLENHDTWQHAFSDIDQSIAVNRRSLNKEMSLSVNSSMC